MGVGCGDGVGEHAGSMGEAAAILGLKLPGVWTGSKIIPWLPEGFSRSC